METVICVDVLRRAGVETILASVGATSSEHPLICSRGVRIHADCPAHHCHDLYDVVVLPGGQPGATTLRDSKIVQKLITKHNEAGKLIAAVCAAPIVLAQMCLLKGRNAPLICSRGVRIHADCPAHHCHDLYDVVVLPGGQPGATTLRDSKIVQKLITKHNEAGKLIAAVCAAPIVLAQMCLLKGRNATSHPSVESTLVEAGATYSQNRVVKDGNIITSRGPGTCFEFAIQIACSLSGDDNSADVHEALAKPMML
eukprot:TRINITY_DN3908_c0_g1_i2.p1 TRINITY_DN3908_c0_g1~~TRINITY_DN3908_c0_g1_i2.p1  ORF type:complete len:296 (+),score=26.83 TRINITY_DN3908_c0_g1_i2:124-888(+)